MSVAWATQRAPCGHRRCTAAGWAMIAAAPCLIAGLAWLIVSPSARAAALFGASVLTCGASIPISCRSGWIEDGGGADSTLGEIFADPPLPRRWTRADWAELERQLSTCPDQTEED